MLLLMMKSETSVFSLEFSSKKECFQVVLKEEEIQTASRLP